MTILIAALNEEEAIAGTLERIAELRYAASSPVRALRHSAAGTSTRASAEITRASSARIVRCPASSA